MLQQHPLRELTIDVKVNSVQPLKSVTSPTHTTRDERTAHSAHVEFTAQAYTPTRDFEVVVEVEGRQADVVMIPHRRGDDGYFMLQLTPPGPAGNWDRPLLADGAPVHLLILADTSGNIDRRRTAARRKRRFIGCCSSCADAQYRHVQPRDLRRSARLGLSRRRRRRGRQERRGRARFPRQTFTSLGWTNLDNAFASALKQSGPQTHVIYVGDGIVTNGDAENLIDFTGNGCDCANVPRPGAATFHAVTLGSSYESSRIEGDRFAGQRLDAQDQQRTRPNNRSARVN